MTGGVDVNVNITSLEDSITWLRGMRQTLVDQFIPKFDEIGAKTGSDVDNSPFGGPKVATRQELWQKHRSLWENAYTTYNTIAQELQKTIDGTQRVIDNYRTTEQRNAANAADIETLLSDTANQPAGGGQTTPTSTSRPPATDTPATDTPATDGSTTGKEY